MKWYSLVIACLAFLGCDNKPLSPFLTCKPENVKELIEEYKKIGLLHKIEAKEHRVYVGKPWNLMTFDNKKDWSLVMLCVLYDSNVPQGHWFKILDGYTGREIADFNNGSLTVK